MKKVIFLLGVLFVLASGVGFSEPVYDVWLADTVQINNQYINYYQVEYPVLSIGDVAYIPLIDEYTKALLLEYEVKSGDLFIRTTNGAYHEIVRYVDEICERESRYDAERFTGRLFINDEQIKLDKHPIIVYKGVPYLPAIESIFVDGMGYKLDYIDGITGKCPLVDTSQTSVMYESVEFPHAKCRIYLPSIDPSEPTSVYYSVQYEDGKYIGEMKSTGFTYKRHGYGRFIQNDDVSIEGLWEYDKLIKKFEDNDAYLIKLSEVLVRASEKYIDSKMIPWIDRTWKDICETNTDNYTIYGIDEMNNEIVRLEEKYNTAKLAYQKSAGIETTYWITGDVLGESSEAILVYGQAYGFGEGMCENTLIKIFKPTEGLNLMGKYSGTHIFVGKEVNGVEIYNTYKDMEITDAAKVQLEIMGKVARELKYLKDELKKTEIGLQWWNQVHSSINEDGSVILYNRGGGYTIELPSEVEIVESETYDYIIKSKSPELVSEIVDIYFSSADSYNITINDMYTSAVEKGGKYGYYMIEQKKELIDLSNGIEDAYMIYNPNSGNGFALYLEVPDKLLEIKIVISDDVDSYQSRSERYLDVIGTIKSIVMYYSVN